MAKVNCSLLNESIAIYSLPLINFLDDFWHSIIIQYAKNVRRNGVIMIKKFRKKTILILTIIFWVTLIGILLAINISNYQSNRSDTKKLLSLHIRLSDPDHIKNGLPPTEKKPKISKIYNVILDKNEKYSVVLPFDDSGYSKEVLISIAKKIISAKKKEGILNHFIYNISDADNGQMISFMDYSIWERQQKQMLIYSVIIGLGGMIILFISSVLLTGWLIKPVITAFERQKQFISDAGHELKTPLTVMKAGLDMLESQCENNKYFGYIKEENNRMTELVYDLLSLSSLDDAENKINFEKIDLSRIIEGTCLPFECLAFEKGLHLELQIQDEITISGNQKQISQLIEVLLDNAIKHTFANGTVIVQLKKSKGKAILLVKNEGEPIPESERTKIFDRFYRVDKSRNRMEGRYGLGLAIAGSIARIHKSKISVDCKENWTIFSVKFN